MKSERWQQIERLYQAALELEEKQRAAFLSEACSDDDKLRREVQSLVIEQLGIALFEPQRRSLEARPTENLEAYDFYLRGNDYLNRGRELNSAEQIEFVIPMRSRRCPSAH